MTIRIKDSTTYADGKQNVYIALPSTDTKPTDVATGSTCVEVDTGKHYVFDEDSGEWTEEQTSGGGGGGGGSDFSTAKLTLVNEYSSEYTDDGFVACILEEIGTNVFVPIPYHGITIGAKQTVELTLILYDGNALVGITPGNVDRTTGSIEWESTFSAYHITGDATVYFGR